MPGIREIGIKFSGTDIINEPIEVRPVCHYMMGGIHTNIDGATEMVGLWVAGEAACNNTHGANRLGANSTSECIVWGKITGELRRDMQLEKRLTPLIESRFLRRKSEYTMGCSTEEAP